MPNYKALNALAEIRDYMRETGQIPDPICDDFNRVAKSLGADPDWCMPAPELTPEQKKESDRLLSAMIADRHNHLLTKAPVDMRNQFTWCEQCQDWFLPRVGPSRKKESLTRG